VHLFLDDIERRLPQVQALLDAEAIPYDSIEQVPPTIEDFFVQTLERTTSGRVM
jgi:hypothetical protein